jgi:hypothetical protein
LPRQRGCSASGTGWGAAKWHVLVGWAAVRWGVVCWEGSRISFCSLVFDTLADLLCTGWPLDQGVHPCRTGWQRKGQVQGEIIKRPANGGKIHVLSEEWHLSSQLIFMAPPAGT